MPEPTILDTIVARRKLDVAEAKLAKPAQALQAALAGAPTPSTSPSACAATGRWPSSPK
ncbi:hypothetical protein [Candidatus Amarobacter glycogenicus]|uniref:hypothetical protein n=1 Tax=Candidatus Amarobacter glycogenicus TaxID=3140699 RepID=UPI0031CCAAAB